MKLSNRLVGQKFGRLTVLRDSGLRTKNRGILWKCKCECGVIKNITGSSLCNGATISCGCYSREIFIARTKNRAQINSLIGKKFGRLTVLRDSGLRSYGNILWECRCECGTMKNVITKFLKNGKIVSCGCHKIDRALDRAKKIGLEKEARLVRWGGYKKRSGKEARHKKRLVDRIYGRELMNKLSDLYIKRLLTASSSLKFSDIPIELIEAKREALKIHRFLQEGEK